MRGWLLLPQSPDLLRVLPRTRAALLTQCAVASAETRSVSTACIPAFGCWGARRTSPPCTIGNWGRKRPRPARQGPILDPHCSQSTLDSGGVPPGSSRLLLDPYRGAPRGAPCIACFLPQKRTVPGRWIASRGSYSPAISNEGQAAKPCGTPQTLGRNGSGLEGWGPSSGQPGTRVPPASTSAIAGSRLQRLEPSTHLPRHSALPSPPPQ